MEIHFSNNLQDQSLNIKHIKSFEEPMIRKYNPDNLSSILKPTVSPIPHLANTIRYPEAYTVPFEY